MMPVTADTALAFWVTAPNQGEIRGEALPPAGEGEVLVRALYSGISRGSEALVFRGQVPASEYQRMRAPFQSGDFPVPVKYGYVSVGEVEQGPPELRGRSVFCLYPHQTRYVVPASAVLPLPERVPAARAVLAANLETAVNAVWDARPSVGDRVAVVGAGTLGCLTAWLIGQFPGSRVQLVDVDQRRQPLADALGVGFATPEQAAGECDLVVHSSGTPAGLETALAMAGFEATVLELSWYGDQQVPAPLGQAFHSRRLILRSSQVGAIPCQRRARWDFNARLRLALRLLEAPALDRLISGESPFQALPEIMARLANDPDGSLCHRIRYD